MVFAVIVAFLALSKFAIIIMSQLIGSPVTRFSTEIEVERIYLLAKAIQVFLLGCLHSDSQIQPAVEPTLES